MAKFRKLNEKGEKIKGDNPTPITTKEEIQDVVKEALSEFADGIEEFEGENFVVCPTCRVPFIFESDSGECAICGAKYKDGQWSFKKRKKVKVEEGKKEVLLENLKAIQNESDVLEEIDIGESGAPEFLEVKCIGASECDGCNKKVNWDSIEPYYSRVPFMSGIAKKCPECDKEVYWLDVAGKKWVLKAEFDNREEEEDDFFNIV